MSKQPATRAKDPTSETGLLPQLRKAGLITSDHPQIRPLSGGVSCDIQLIEDGGRRFVVKRALDKLRVKDDWFADTTRNHFEQAYMRYAGRIAPGSVPRVLHADEANNYFVMEFLGEGWVNWKTELLAGRIDPACARTAGVTLAKIHQTSWGDDALRKQFATTPNFHKLRIEPYLVTTGRRNPALESYFLAAAEELESTSLALVHGDFSPKNILLRAGTAEIAILDCEVAWFGDPAFDIAFLLNHFFLKAANRPELKQDYLSLGSAFLDAYRPGLGAQWLAELEARAVRLLLLLMLARVDGKSPVEYLAERPDKQRQIREFVTRELPDPPHELDELSHRWMNDLT